MRLLPGRSRRPLGAGLALLLSSCGGGGGDDPVGPRQPDPTAVALVSVSPASTQVDVGATVQLAVAVSNSQGGVVSAPVTWSTSDSGVATVSAVGLVTGVAAGSVTISASAGGRSGTAAVTVVAPEPLAVTSDTLPEGRVGAPYSATLAAVGGREPRAWAAVDTLPADLALNASGVLSGTPAAEGTFTFSVRVTSADGQTADGALSLQVADVLEIRTTSLPSATVGQTYSVTLEASGSSAGRTWSVASGALPAGITLDPSSGALSGTPEASGTAEFTMRVAVADGREASAGLQLVVNAGPVRVTTDGLAAGVVGVPYSDTLRAAGGDGTSFTWSVITGGLPPGLSLGADGVVSGTPAAPGTVFFTVLASSGGRSGSRELGLTVTAPPSSGFDVTMVFLAPVSPVIQTAFENAAARWQSVITGDVSDYDPLPPCGNFHPATPAGVDDIILYITVDSIDGPGQIVGGAAPCFLRDDTRPGEEYLPITGFMQFDDADLAQLAAQRILGDVVLHEMGHALGIGTVWEPLEFVQPLGPPDPVTGRRRADCVLPSDPFFNGPRAIAAFDAAGGAAFPGAKVPIENTGTRNDGTNCSHWRESSMRTELMTGFLGLNSNPLSAITIESLGDMGYEVDASLADPYVVPVPFSLRRPGGEGIDLSGDVLPIRPGIVGRDGRIRTPPALPRR